MIVLDTSALLFWTLDPLRLSIAARQSIDSTDRLIVSAISIWEIALKVKQSRLEIHPAIDEYIEGLAKLDRLEIEPVGVETWVSSMNFDWEHRDPADRVIVATALRHKSPLVTSDRVIRDFYAATVW